MAANKMLIIRQLTENDAQEARDVWAQAMRGYGNKFIDEFVQSNLDDPNDMGDIWNGFMKGTSMGNNNFWVVECTDVSNFADEQLCHSATCHVWHLAGNSQCGIDATCHGNVASLNVALDSDFDHPSWNATLNDMRFGGTWHVASAAGNATFTVSH